MGDTGTNVETDALRIRVPEAQDGQGIYRCVETWGGLDPNSPYAYFLVCDRFAEYSAVAELDGKIVGFVMGLKTADKPDALFVWQVGVSPDARGMRVAGRMIDAILDRVGASYLDAHVGSQNQASEALFRGVARRRSAPVAESVAYPAEWFPPGHDTERLLRIGPFGGASK